MKSLSALCRQYGTTISDLSQAISVPERSLLHQFSTGLIPYVLVHKVAEGLGVPVAELVTPGLINDWAELYDGIKRAQKPRGAAAQRVKPGNIVHLPMPERNKKMLEVGEYKTITIPKKEIVKVKQTVARKEKSQRNQISDLLGEELLISPINLSALADLRQEEPTPIQVPEGPPDLSSIADDAFKM